ncbi:MAG TPA: hypothetical protein PKE56_02810 [Acidimicrobiales bacterium]|nr:hypothetical protein [Acidimicrobiales bacterium]
MEKRIGEDGMYTGRFCVATDPFSLQPWATDGDRPSETPGGRTIEVSVDEG